MDAETPLLVLCSTARLARSLRLLHGRQQRTKGKTQWRPLAALTLEQWLKSTLEQALLQGDIAADEIPRMALTSMQEIALWERVIERMLPADSAVLFDRAGLAKTAQEANRLMQEWNIAVPSMAGGYGYAQEVEQFLHWQAEFRKQCRASGWLESTRYMDWQIAQIGKGAGDIPSGLFIAGYDRISPQEQRLIDALKARAVNVRRWPHLLESPSAAVQVALTDSEAECRAAVSWAAARLSANPQSRLAIVAPELASLRERLTALLDDVLHPAALSPALAESARSYDLSLGAALSRQPIITAALDLLKLAGNRRHVSQQDFSKVLLGPYWSAGSTEADARAQLDARMRAHLPLNLTLERLLRFIKKQSERGLAVPHLSDTLGALLDALAGPPFRLPSRQMPSLWAPAIARLLKTAEWPGQRSLSSHEYQSCKAFNRALEMLAGFDLLSGAMTFAQAVQRLVQVCAEEVFQPESVDDPQILVMGMLETVGAPLDAMWVMGMNDHVWPPAARPNPLLPAAQQRAVRAPNADGPVQAEFASVLHERLLKSAHEIVFSWAHKSGDSELRVSPLMQGLPLAAIEDVIGSLAETLAEKLAYGTERAEIKQYLDDHRAPPVGAGEKISGGAGLIRAQAICPAWAYYRYRLGARPLEEPVEGLDSMDRGNLVHAVLQSFWQGHDSAYLDQPEASLQAAIAQAVDDGVERFSKKLEEPLPPKFLALEKQRLQYLLTVWLAYESKRPPFAVEQCEQEEHLDIAGMNIKLILDRVDRLPDGKLVVIDYKTGSGISHDSWAERRISEPQLSIYSSLVLADEHIAAVCFAQVRADEQRFVGIAAEADILPGIKALHESQKLFPPDIFSDWVALLGHWKSSIEAIANELVAGEAAVVFTDEKDLRYCDVLPLLRLPERDLQMEAADKKLQQRLKESKP